jgi:tetratricopeptide (TPR) repeat protein
MPVPEQKQAVPLRVFFSYGHDANEELVRLIKADLERRGHSVWFDQSKIKSGTDWRRAITDGILQSHCMLSFLSKYSVRDPGVCLDEIAIAIGSTGSNIQTILVESEQQVKPPGFVKEVQWVDMHDWKDRRDEGGDRWARWYQDKLSEIIAHVESDESRRRAVEITALQRYLNPITSDFVSDPRIRTLIGRQIVGREWVFNAVEEWRTAQDRSSPLFWIMGEPGTGKSIIAAHLAYSYGRGTVIAVHFCDWQKPDHRNAARVVRTLAFQIAKRLPDYRKVLLLILPRIGDLDGISTADLFAQLLTNPLRSLINGGRERYLVVIDALDEAGGSGRNQLVELLAVQTPLLPDWLAVVVTSRPEADVKTRLQAVNPLLLDTRSELNKEDIRNYLRIRLANDLESHQCADRVVEQILEKTNGVFLYAECFCNGVRDKEYSLDNPSEFPKDLGAFFVQYFQRQFPNKAVYRKVVAPVLRCILAARDPLPIEILLRAFRWDKEQFQDLRQRLGALFPITRLLEGDVIQPFHKSVADWLTDDTKADSYIVDPTSAHTVLADAGWHPRPPYTAAGTIYFGRHLAQHVAEARQWERFAEMLKDPHLNLLQKWIDQGDLETGYFCLKAYIGHLEHARSSSLDVEALKTQLARIELRTGNLAAADTLLVAAMDRLKISRHQSLFAIAAHEYGSVCLEQGNPDKAIIWYRMALRAARRQHPPLQTEIAANLVALATTYQVKQRNIRCVRRPATLALAAARLASDNPHEIEALRILADCCKDELVYGQAENYLADGLSKAHEHELPYAEMALLVTQGWMQYHKTALHLSTATDSMIPFQQLAKRAQSYGHARFLADARTGMGQWALLRRDAAGVLEAISELEELLMSGACEHIRVRLQLLRAGYLLQQHALPEAVLAYQDACGAADATQLLPRQADARVGLGAALWHTGATAEAWKQWAASIAYAWRCVPVRRRLVAASIRASRQDPGSTPL